MVNVSKAKENIVNVINHQGSNADEYHPQQNQPKEKSLNLSFNFKIKMDDFSAFINFLLEKKFRLIEDNKQLKIVAYELNELFIQIMQDRNLQRFISLSRTNNHSWEGWYDMDVVRFLILQAHYKVDDAFYEFEQLSQFFMDYYDEIIKAFSFPNFSLSEKVLSTLKNERAKERFGY